MDARLDHVSKSQAGDTVPGKVLALDSNLRLEKKRQEIPNYTHVFLLLFVCV